MALTERRHGGPDASGPVPHDFSTNANACGPCPGVLEAVAGADARSYPDPGYRRLRDTLAAFHGVEAGRIVPAASASEAIQRITARAVQRSLRRVSVPARAYGDYGHAARAWGLPVVADAVPGLDTLAWLCDPSSPLGQPCAPVAGTEAGLRVLDRAYAPLRLEGADPWPAGALDRVWQLHTPNKALGLTGLRGAYLIAPDGEEDEARALDRLAASWCIGAHGLALLLAWCRPDTQAWLAASRATLRGWKAAQQAVCAGLDWRCLPSEANFFVARLPVALTPTLVQALRGQGVRLRDCASFGLPGHVRLGVLPPASHAALAGAWRHAATIAGPQPRPSDTPPP